MNLAIDIGNTKTKAAFFVENSIIEQYDDVSIDTIQSLNLPFENLIISSVSHSTEEWKKQFQGKFIVELNHLLPLPFKNEYQTPQTLGMDRIASIAGAKSIFPTKNLLVIDAGTCITFDFLKNNAYQGGAIAPGIQMKLKALNNFTAKLPLVPLQKEANLIGKTTHESILSGVLNGTIAEINYTIEEYKRINDNLAVILCGGDAKLLSKSLKNVDLVENELVLKGLNTILNYNVKKY